VKPPKLMGDLPKKPWVRGGRFVVAPGGGAGASFHQRQVFFRGAGGVYMFSCVFWGFLLKRKFFLGLGVGQGAAKPSGEGWGGGGGGLSSGKNIRVLFLITQVSKKNFFVNFPGGACRFGLRGPVLAMTRGFLRGFDVTAQGGNRQGGGGGGGGGVGSPSGAPPKRRGGPPEGLFRGVKREIVFPGSEGCFGGEICRGGGGENPGGGNPRGGGGWVSGGGAAWWAFSFREKTKKNRIWGETNKGQKKTRIMPFWGKKRGPPGAGGGGGGGRTGDI